MATINLSQLSCPKENYFSVLQYNRSKYCNVLHMHYLASKLAERHVVVHSVHPGNMVRTGIQRRWWGWKLLFALASPFTKSVSQGSVFFHSIDIIIGSSEGAATQLYALCHPTTAEFTGVYWNNCAPCEPIAPAINDDNSLQLELLSKKLCADFIQA
ncbi:Oidioi.mRNA.OKI2018_I69.PAR.g12681.t1.cds [Oikopleura dioica]|uniref:Oidioi.mRNA.OKI2018_I69.PAR.g12681.t1.cds n=1 Tax=Oikopleura dioica TaxID=34765 RepID=A0ABN7S4F3_OIKDI|nr:Oidioi.mRNA.OKI2018_I69.PAR.g12681.t1.cds [Oikopleura dioica]